MKLPTLTPGQSRMLALVLLVIAVLLAITAIALPVYMANRYYDQAIEHQLDLLARYRRVAAAAPGLAGQLGALKAKEARGFFLKNATPALAASEIQEIVKGAVEGNGGKIITMQISEHKDDGNYRKASLNIQMSARITAIQKIFYTLETQRPYLFLDNVSIRSAGWQPARPANMPVPEQDFMVQFEVAAYAVLEAK